MILENALALALASGFFSFVAVSVILTLTRQVEIRPQERRLGGIKFIALALAFLPMALVEEFLFRWLLIGQLNRWIGIIPAFLLSIAAFVAAHRPNGRLRFLTVLNLAIVSAVLGFVYLRWGLWVVSAAHAGWNIAEWGMGYAVSGEKTRTLLPAPVHREVKGEPFGPEGHWSTTIVLLSVLFILVDLHRPPF